MLAVTRLFVLISLIDLNESAVPDQIQSNLEIRRYLHSPLDRDTFDAALASLTAEGHVSEQEGGIIEIEYSAYGLIEDLHAEENDAGLTENGRMRLKEIEAYAADIFVDDDTWAAELEKERKEAEQIVERERLLEAEKALTIGYPYDILLQARETKRGGSSVYVVLLDDRVRDKRRVRIGSDPSLAAVYVGMTGLAPRERFENHKTNYKAGRGYVRDYGICLMAHLYEAYNPMPHRLAIKAEKALAEKLRLEGYTVLGGH